MATTTVRAEDSAQAMDEIIAQLGPDALILSTVKREGMVEITATTDPVPPKVAPSPDPKPTAEVVHIPLQDAPAPEAADASEETSGFARLFKSRMGPPPETPEEGAADTPSEPLAPLLQRLQIAPAKTVLAARRLVLVGRVGSGKSLHALQLAAELASRGDEVRLSFVGASHADGAYLMSKARLVGCPMDFISPDSLRTPVRDIAVHIVVVSGRIALPTAVIDALSEQENTRTVLAMPVGLRRKTVLANASQWRALDPVVSLLTPPADTLETEDLSCLVDAGLPLTWVSSLKTVVQALVPADRATLAEALSAALPAGVQSLYARQPSKTGGVE